MLTTLGGRPLSTKREKKRKKTSGGASERVCKRTTVPANREDIRTHGRSGRKKWVARVCQEVGKGGKIARFVRGK